MSGVFYEILSFSGSGTTLTVEKTAMVPCNSDLLVLILNAVSCKVIDGVMQIELRVDIIRLTD